MGYIFAILSALAAGTSVATGKLGILSISTPWYLFYVSLFSLILTWLYRFTTHVPSLNIIPRKSRWHLVGHILSSYLAMLSFWMGTRYLNAAVASFLVRGETLVILVLSIAFLRERFKLLELFGAFAILTGVFVISRSESPNVGDLQSLLANKAVFLIILSASAWGSAKFPLMGATRFPFIEST